MKDENKSQTNSAPSEGGFYVGTGPSGEYRIVFFLEHDVHGNWRFRWFDDKYQGSSTDHGAYSKAQVALEAFRNALEDKGFTVEFKERADRDQPEREAGKVKSGVEPDPQREPNSGRVHRTEPERESVKENASSGPDPSAKESKTPDERVTQTGPESEEDSKELIEGLTMVGMGAGLIPVAGDWISLGISGAIFVLDPSWGNLLDLGLDIAGALPGVPALGTLRKFSRFHDEVGRKTIPKGLPEKSDSLVQGGLHQPGQSFIVLPKGKNATMGTKKRNGSHGGKTSKTFEQGIITGKPLDEKMRTKMRQRVQELHRELDPRSQRAKTTAVVIVRDPKTGKTHKLVSSSSERLPKSVRDQLKPDEIEVRGSKKSSNSSPKDHAHHAEVNALSCAASNGWEVVEIFPSRNACTECAKMRKILGVVINDPS